MSIYLQAGTYRVLASPTFTDTGDVCQSGHAEGSLIVVERDDQYALDGEGDVRLPLGNGLERYISPKFLERVDVPETGSLLDRVLKDVASLLGVDVPEVNEVVLDVNGYAETVGPDGFSIGHDVSEANVKTFLEEALPQIAAARDISVYLARVESGEAAVATYRARRMEELGTDFDLSKGGEIVSLADHLIDLEIAQGRHNV